MGSRDQKVRPTRPAYDEREPRAGTPGSPTPFGFRTRHRPKQATSDPTSGDDFGTLVVDCRQRPRVAPE